MYKILRKQVLSHSIKLMEIKVPLVANKARPGQFVIVRMNETGERIPLTIADFSKVDGTITVIFQEVGKSTIQMGQMDTGDSFENVVGPLGRPTEIENYGKVVVVGGGVGIAPIFPIARGLKLAGNEVISIIGARDKSLLFWEDRMKGVSNQLITCTDDGSAGRKALVTEPLKELLETRKDIAHVWAIGPAIMMKFVAAATKPFNIPTTVSLNTIMIDGTGMCGGCRVVMVSTGSTQRDGGAKFVCVDGPEFDAHHVDWESMLSRMSFYREEEKLSAERWLRHECRMGFETRPE